MKINALFITMKLSILIQLLFLVPVSATVYSQQITLKYKNTELETVLKSIESQSGYVFFYDENDLPILNRVDVDLKNENLNEILQKCFENQPITYRIFNNTIVLKKKDQVFTRKLVQQRTIRGTIKDKERFPIPGATIVKKGTLNGTVSDINGNFVLNNISEETTITISFTGYLSQEILVKDGSVFNIVLTEDIQGLEEVVVVGYGTRKRVNLTGAVSTLNMSEKENQPLTNVSQALHGVSGLWVNQAGGKPGQDVGSIKIRGVGTLNNSNPLVLVDGIEYNMNDVNPAFIESVTVLKDATAAIYGSRAANGVILVTTKEGAKGKTKVNYSFSHGIQAPTLLPDVEWNSIKYMQLKNQALINEGKTTVDYSDELIDEYRVGMTVDPLAYPSVNWFDVILKNGYLQQHNLSFSGGTDKVTYNLGLGYMNQDGILIDANHAERYSLNLNLTANITDKLKVGANIIGNYREYTEPALGSNATDYFFNRFMRALPIYGTYLPDGRYANLAVPTPSRSGTENWIQYLKEGSNVHTPQRVLAKVFAEYKLPFDITYSLNFGLDKLDATADKFEPIMTAYHPQLWTPSSANVIASAENYYQKVLHTTIYQTLNWEKDFSGHSISGMLGQSFEKYNNSSFKSRIEGYFDNSLTDLNAGSLNPTVSGGTSQDILASYFGRAGYSYNDKYLLDVTFRYDGSSRFARNNRWGFFPAISAGWRIDKESFFNENNDIDLLKVRASYGQMGNQSTVDLYGYMNTVSLNQNYNFNGEIFPGSAVTRYGDPNISWEKTTSYNIGLDFEAWSGKFGASADVFKRRTSGILRPVTIPAQVGALTGPTMNVGVVDNQGFELNLSHRNKINDLDYTIQGGISFVKNKVVDLNGETIISGRRIIKEGYPIDSYYLYVADGLYQNEEEVANSVTVSNLVKPGYIRYRDISNDNKIDGEDRVIMGSSIPKYNYSFGLNLNYKGFGLDAFFQGVNGINIYPTLNLAYPFNNGAGVTKEWATDSWTPENPNAKLPILTTATGATENFQNSSFWLKDASYLRLKSLQLNYQLPINWISSLSLSKVNLFVNGQNLFTFSNYKDFDPEKDIAKDTFYEYPSLKTYSFGVNVTF